MPEAVEESTGEGLERIRLWHFEQLFLLSLKVLSYSLLLCTHSPQLSNCRKKGVGFTSDS